MTNAKHPHPADPAALAALGQQMILNTLSAEMAALQVIMPGITTAQPLAPNADDCADAAFDNMPV